MIGDVTECRSIYGDAKSLAAQPLGLLDYLSSDILIAVDIELIELNLARFSRTYNV